MYLTNSHLCWRFSAMHSSLCFCFISSRCKCVTIDVYLVWKDYLRSVGLLIDSFLPNPWIGHGLESSRCCSRFDSALVPRRQSSSFQLRLQGFHSAHRWWNHPVTAASLFKMKRDAIDVDLKDVNMAAGGDICSLLHLAATPTCANKPAIQHRSNVKLKILVLTRTVRYR